MTLTSDPQTTDTRTVLQQHIDKMADRLAAARAACNQIATWWERHPEVPLREHSGDEGRLVAWANSADEWSAWAAALKDGAAIGEVAKEGNSSYLYYKRKFGAVTVEIIGEHEAVCERVQTGSVLRTVPDPALVAELPTVEVEEPVYEWKCPPVLGGGEAA